MQRKKSNSERLNILVHNEQDDNRCRIFKKIIKVIIIIFLIINGIIISAVLSLLMGIFDRKFLHFLTSINNNLCDKMDINCYIVTGINGFIDILLLILGIQVIICTIIGIIRLYNYILKKIYIKRINNRLFNNISYFQEYDDLKI